MSTNTFLKCRNRRNILLPKWTIFHKKSRFDYTDTVHHCRKGLWDSFFFWKKKKTYLDFKVTVIWLLAICTRACNQCQTGAKYFTKKNWITMVILNSLENLNFIYTLPNITLLHHVVKSLKVVTKSNFVSYFIDQPFLNDFVFANFVFSWREKNGFSQIWRNCTLRKSNAISRSF